MVDARSLLKSYKEETKAPKKLKWASNIYYGLSMFSLVAGVLAAVGFVILLLIIALMGEAFGGVLLSDLGIVALTSGMLLVFLGGAMIALGIGGLFVARGMRRGQRWAMIVALAVSGLNILGFVFSLNEINILNVILAVLHGIVFYTLLLDTESKKFFAK